jgi:hypothetical protein
MTAVAKTINAKKLVLMIKVFFMIPMRIWGMDL